jgi:hypothetical protein
MKSINLLFRWCAQSNYNCSITYQRINEYSVEIYKGYKTNYEKIYYSDGHLTPLEAAKQGLKFLRIHSK